MNEKRDLMTERLQLWKLKKQGNLQKQTPRSLQVRNQNKTPTSGLRNKENMALSETKLQMKKKEAMINSNDRDSSFKEKSKSPSMREKLEKWKEEKGKNKLDTVNPLLTRKRPLYTSGYESYEIQPKKTRKSLSKIAFSKHPESKKKGIEEEESIKTSKEKKNNEDKIVMKDVDENKNKEQESHDENQEERLPSYTHVSSEVETPLRLPNVAPIHGVTNSLAVRSQFNTPKNHNAANTPRGRKTICCTPLQKHSKSSSSVTRGVLNSAPQRRSISTIRCHQNQLTPFSKIKSLPGNSVLKSAPSRRTMSTIKEFQRKQTPARTARKSVGSVLSEKPRRRTIAGNCLNDARPVIAPFTPRGEWQNENLSIRERLDLWLSVRGKTVTKPYVVIRKTPAPKRFTSRTTDDHEEIEEELNRTFDLDDLVDEKQEETKAEKYPKMNEIERKVIEESMEQVLERIEKGCEFDIVREELDLIQSTSPGVVRLAAYWVARARLAAKSETIERVICLLEQANAFDAEPQDLIKDEICEYLEKLKADETHTNEDFTEPLAEIADITNQGKTPAKRVKFMDTQKHLAFNSSLIKFCLLECTPFKRRLKSTLAKQILTPVRRSGRIEKSQSRLPSILRNHVPTASSPSEFTNENNDGGIYCLPNYNLESKWNEIWEEGGQNEGKIEQQEQVNQDLSF